ncbi:amidohydrolase family protein [Aurantivibrio infirmus]
MTETKERPVIHEDHQWLEAVQEEIIDPGRPIIDPHHHLWQRRRGSDYVLSDFWADTDSGHNIVSSVFIECHTNYLEDGPEHLRPVGETQFVADIAAQSRLGDTNQCRVAAIVAGGDLCLEAALVEELLAVHQHEGKGLFRGVRHAGAWEDDGDFLLIRGRGPKGLYANKNFRKSVRLLGAKGFTYDTWHYHHQNQSFLDFVKAVPDTTIVLDHFGTPLGVGPYAGKRAEIFQQWKKDIADIAQCPNVYAKLGGLAMPDNGFGWNLRDVPPSSDEFVAAQKDYYLHTLDCFGPDRCMFESNFPVDKYSLSYHVVWNAFKKMSDGFSDSEKDALFFKTAEHVYGL